MPVPPTLLMTIPIALAAGPWAAAAEATARAPRHQFSLEAVPVAGVLGYAFAIGPHAALGIKLGLGFDLTTLVPVAGAHFTYDWGLAYRERDPYTSSHYGEVMRAAVFLRRFLKTHWQLEGGLRASAGLHSNSSDDEPAAAYLLAAYGAVFWGGRYLAIGSQLSIGPLAEPRDESGTLREWALVVTPVVLKLSLPGSVTDSR